MKQIESSESVKKLMDEAQSEPEYSDDKIQDTAVDDLVEPESGVGQTISKKDDSRKANDRNQRDDRSSNKRSRTGAVTAAALFAVTHWHG